MDITSIQQNLVMDITKIQQNAVMDITNNQQIDVMDITNNQQNYSSVDSHHYEPMYGRNIGWSNQLFMVVIYWVVQQITLPLQTNVEDELKY